MCDSAHARQFPTLARRASKGSLRRTHQSINSTPTVLHIEAQGSSRSDQPWVSDPATVLPGTGCIIFGEQMRQALSQFDSHPTPTVRQTTEVGTWMTWWEMGNNLLASDRVSPAIAVRLERGPLQCPR